MAGSPAWSGMAAPRPAFVDTAGGSSEQPCRGGEATRTTLGMPITQLPGRPVQPTGAAAAAAWGQGEGKAPCEAQGNLPGGPSNRPDPEWAGWGTSIILCRAGMWKPEPSPLVWQVGGTFPRRGGGGADTRPVRQVCQE